MGFRDEGLGLLRSLGVEGVGLGSGLFITKRSTARSKGHESRNPKTRAKLQA